MALIKNVNGKSPRWGQNCYFSENASLVGDITMGDDCSVWFGAVLRADVDAIRIGNRVNIQDCACIHQTGGFPTVIEDDVSLGHGAIAHACTVHKGALLGMNAVVLDRADIGEGAIVAAGAVVLEGTKVGPYEIWAGVPARLVKKASPEQALAFSKNYLKIKEWFKE
ncbi:MAG: gamma carbonic anhydrase family protein [Prevotella sp.]|nr:gamma carbonic anhydrase family protein [Prevotella sp.]MCH3996021.1 gamma carbonic anhydrase family protein [Prevotella sp.]